jgi:hypothetical protein
VISALSRFSRACLASRYDDGLNCQLEFRSIARRPKFGASPSALGHPHNFRRSRASFRFHQALLNKILLVRGGRSENFRLSPNATFVMQPCSSMMPFVLSFFMVTVCKHSSAARVAAPLAPTFLPRRSSCSLPVSFHTYFLHWDLETSLSSHHAG